MGARIVILGASNAGKSTLAAALGAKLSVPAVHLDQLRFHPGTNWHLRDEEAFEELHHNAISQDAWVMEGNYSALLPPRLERCTDVIILGANRWRRFTRYAGRILARGKGRLGAPRGAPERFSYEMAGYVLSKKYEAQERFSHLLALSEKPVISCHSAKSLNALYDQWGLRRPQ